MKGHGLSPQRKPVASNLRGIRESKGLSRLALSLDTDSMISVTTVVRAEAGDNTRIRTAIELCNALGVTLNDVYGDHLTALNHKE